MITDNVIKRFDERMQTKNGRRAFKMFECLREKAQGIVIARYGATKEEAEDAVQVAIIKCTAYFNGDNNCKYLTFLIIVARRVIVSYKRGLYQQNEVTYGINVAKGIPLNRYEQSESGIIGAMMTRDMVKQIREKDSTYSSVLALFIDGYDYEECCELLSLPLGTVKSRLNRARKQMASTARRIGFDE